MYARVLWIAELAREPGRHAGFLARLGAEHVDLLGYAPVPATAWVGLRGWGAAEAAIDAGEAQLAEARAALRAAVPSVGGELLLRLDGESVGEAITRYAPDVVLVGPVSARSIPAALSVLDDVVRVHRRPALWTAGRDPDARGEPLAEIVAPFDGDLRAMGPVTAFLRDRCGPTHRAALLVLDHAADVDLAELAELVGVRARLELVRPEAGVLEAMVALSAEVERRRADLVVVSDGPPRSAHTLRTWMIVVGSAWRTTAPVLVLPAAQAGEAWDGPLDASDAIVARAVAPFRVERLGSFGQPALLPDVRLAVVVPGQAFALDAEAGQLLVPGGVLPDGPGRFTVGLTRPGETDDPVLFPELTVTAVRTEAERVVLVDAAVVRPGLPALPEGPVVVAVRLRPTESFRAIRDRLARLGLPPLVLDARAILDEGNADDMPAEVDAVRLCRVAERLRAAGVHVAAVVHDAARPPHARGFLAAHVRALRDPAWLAGADAAFVPPRVVDADDVAGRLDVACAAPLVPGNRVRFDLDNHEGRDRFVELVRGAEQRIHLQQYIVYDDPVVVRQLEVELADAAARGVQIRFLVDSMYSLHGSFGATNPVLDRLAAHDNVRVIASRPVDRIAGIELLKQRDHRKLMIVDGRHAMVTGRNLSRPYYEGFDEVKLDAATSYVVVPWQDAAAWVEGPIVRDIDAAFLRAWTAFGGEPFPLLDAAAVGGHGCRFVVHEGLRDARSHEAWLALIDGARERLDVFNSFPLALEVQRALLRAVRRGVRVRVLFGNVRPLHGAAGTPFPGGAFRDLANALVHARMDAIALAGGEAWEFAVSGVPGWAPDLGPVRPHVHAKVVAVDGQWAATGSANLDLASTYWDSEVMLVVEDRDVAEDLHARLDTIVAGSLRVDPEDEQWRWRASRRATLIRYWPPLIG